MKDVKISRIVLIVAIVAFAIIGIYKNKVKNDFRKQALLEEEANNQFTKVKDGPKKPENKELDVKKKIYVHISGAVNKEGLFELEEGARLNDLIQLCGGFKKEVDMAKVNLSMILSDQMRLHILKLGERPEDSHEVLTNSTNSEPNDKKLNLNQASLEELQTLPGIGEKRAQEIIDYRQKKKFETLEELKNISGIGDKMYDKIKDLLYLP